MLHRDKHDSNRQGGNRRPVGRTTAGVLVAVVVVVGGVLGGVFGDLWSNRHQTTTSPTQKGQTSPSAANTLNTVSSTNAVAANNAASADQTKGPSSPIHTLQMYDAGTLTSVKAVAWPGLQANSTVASTPVPVVQVPYTSALTTHLMSAPKTIATTLPPSLQGKLAAYFVQLDNETSFYLLGPRGMTGNAELAADGSFGVYLHSPQATLELDTSGASPVVADAMAAPFFAAARQSTAGTGGGGPLAPATVIHPSANLAYFSFAAKNGQNVAGVNDYLPQPNGGIVRAIYTADTSDWSYAPNVLRSEVNALTNLLAPQIKGTVVEPHSSTVKLNGKSLSLPQSTGRAVQTDQGVCWIWQPPFVQLLSSEAPWSAVPQEPYNLAIAKPKAGKIPSSSIQLTDSIAFYHLIDGENDAYYAFPYLREIAANRWVLYTVSWAAPGMNQPASNDLAVYDTSTGQGTTLTSFEDTGGAYFSVGTSGDYLVYDKAGATGLGGITHNLWLVNLATLSRTHLPTSDLTQSGQGDVVHTTLNGKPTAIVLSSW